MMTSEELKRVEQLKRAEYYLMNAIDCLKNEGYDKQEVINSLGIKDEQDLEDYLGVFEEE